MFCRANSVYRPALRDLPTGKGMFRSRAPLMRTHVPINATLSIAFLSKGVRSVSFKSMGGCKLGIARYPDFEYNAQGGGGTGSVVQFEGGGSKDEIYVTFDPGTLYIPPLSSVTTKFLGLPLPPLFNIDIVPTQLEGKIAMDSGMVDLEFAAEFLFSVGGIYKAPPLLVKTVLTSEESKGMMRGGRGIRVKDDGICTLVGVAKVDPIDDFFINTFLGLPTECFASMNAQFAFLNSS